MDHPDPRRSDPVDPHQADFQFTAGGSGRAGREHDEQHDDHDAADVRILLFLPAVRDRYLLGRSGCIPARSAADRKCTYEQDRCR